MFSLPAPLPPISKEAITAGKEQYFLMHFEVILRGTVSSGFC